MFFSLRNDVLAFHVLPCRCFYHESLSTFALSDPSGPSIATPASVFITFPIIASPHGFHCHCILRRCLRNYAHADMVCQLSLQWLCLLNLVLWEMSFGRLLTTLSCLSVYLVSASSSLMSSLIWSLYLVGFNSFLKFTFPSVKHVNNPSSCFLPVQCDVCFYIFSRIQDFQFHK